MHRSITDSLISYVLVGLFFFVLGVVLMSESSSSTWVALAAIGTLSSVIVALFLPAYQKHGKKLAIYKILDNEIKKNAAHLNQAIRTVEKVPEELASIEGGEKKFDPVMLAAHQLALVDFSIWQEHWPQYSVLDPDKYEEKNCAVNRMIELRELAIAFKSGDRDSGVVLDIKLMKLVNQVK